MPDYRAETNQPFLANLSATATTICQVVRAGEKSFPRKALVARTNRQSPQARKILRSKNVPRAIAAQDAIFVAKVSHVALKATFPIAVKLTRLGSKEVALAMIGALQGQPLHTITPDRGREFQLHGNVTAALGVEFTRGSAAPTRTPTACFANTQSPSTKNVWVIEYRKKYIFPLRCT